MPPAVFSLNSHFHSSPFLHKLKFTDMAAFANNKRRFWLKTTMVLCVLSLCSSFGASSQAPTPTVDCSSLILNLADCLSYVTNDSTITKPEGTCCSGLKSVLKVSPECLCEGFRNSAQFGVVLNVTKAVGLPAACRVSAPSVTDCGLNTFASGPSPSAGGVTRSSLAPSVATAGGPAAVTEQGTAPAPAPGSSGSAKLSSKSIAESHLVVAVALFALQVSASF